jgi:hypothetical protein
VVWAFKRQNLDYVWRLNPVIPALWKAYVGGLWSEASPGKKLETLSEKEKTLKKKGCRHDSSVRVLT